CHRLRHRRTPELQVANLDPSVERCRVSVAARPEVDGGRAAGLRPRRWAETKGVRRFEQAVERHAVALDLQIYEWIVGDARDAACDVGFRLPQTHLTFT